MLLIFTSNFVIIKASHRHGTKATARPKRLLLDHHAVCVKNKPSTSSWHIGCFIGFNGNELIQKNKSSRTPCRWLEIRDEKILRLGRINLRDTPLYGFIFLSGRLLKLYYFKRASLRLLNPTFRPEVVLSSL